MRKSLQNIKSSTLDYLRNQFQPIHSFGDANKFLEQLCGINVFFRNESEFLLFMSLLRPRSVVSEAVERRDYGDFQTPRKLTDKICELFFQDHFSPQIIIEPTFGKGSFIMSALRCFPNLNRVSGVEIYEPYCWHTKFAILELFIENPNLNKPLIFLYCEDVFKFDFRMIEKSITNEDILVLGNPPWVTNSELSVLNSENLPPKSNFKSYNGLNAITGKGNFDIGEYIILMMLNSFAKCKGQMAMLAKNSVIKNLLQEVPKTTYKISEMVALRFNAKLIFNAAVEASLFKCKFGQTSKQFVCKVSSLESPNLVENEFGWVDSKFVSNVTLYGESKYFDGICPFIWRQGVKHDCSKILELDLVDGEYVNGFNERIGLEDDLIFGLVKSSDIQSSLVTKPRKFIIIPQKKVGEDTSYIADRFPKLYRYLIKNLRFFLARKSSIYSGKPQFAIFGIGDYSFKPYKVAISGLYKKPIFTLVPPFKSKPVMLDDTCYFLGFDEISESLITLAILNSELVQKLLRAIAFIEAKRPYTKDVLMRIEMLKVADCLGFENIRSLLTQLPEYITQSLTKEKWNEFLSKNKKEQAKQVPHTLFEQTSA
jgi:hypothetical protein